MRSLARRLSTLAVTPAHAAPPTACVTGSLTFVDHANQVRPAHHVQVEVWDDDADPDPDDQLVDAADPDLFAVVLTDANGGYTLCFQQGHLEGGNGRQDVYVRFVTENILWKVQEPDTKVAYFLNTPVTADVADFSTTNLGVFSPPAQPGGLIGHRALRAFDAAARVWNWLPGGGCWDFNDIIEGTDPKIVDFCRKIKINWQPGPGLDTAYNATTDEITLGPAEPDVPAMVIHEIGHAIMDDVYEDDLTTWVRSRGDVPAAMQSTSAGPGGAESVTFTAPSTGRYVVVVISKAGSGDVTYTRH